METDDERIDTEQACQCDECRHYYGEDKCKAFPEGIPLTILSGDVEHCHPHAGDHGYTFAPRD